MSSKTFCDECEKEIKDKGVRIVYSIKGFDMYNFCSECFQKHWQGELPKIKE